MTKILFVAFSHTLTQDQISDAHDSLGVGSITLLSQVDESLQKEISQIPADASTQEVVALADRVVSAAIGQGATHFYVAGEPSLVLHASIKAAALGITVVQSTTKRVSVDKVQPDGSVLKTAVFSHVQWRVVL